MDASGLRAHTSMNTPQTRNFGILDAMILVAATAAGLALYRAMSFPPMNGFPKPAMIALAGVEVAVPLLVALTPAVLILRLRRPRPRWRRLARQPGLVACCVAMLILIFEILLIVPINAALFRSLPVFPSGSIFFRGYAGYGVAGGWAIMALGGSWHPEPRWIDRLGRALGFAWIIVNLIAQSLPLLLRS
jgi:hypothetical protein